MPRRRVDGQGHARAPCGAQEAAVRSLVADAVMESHEAHAAARRDPAGSARAFLSEAALPAVRALNRAGAPALLPAMHWIVNASAAAPQPCCTPSRGAAPGTRPRT